VTSRTLSPRCRPRTPCFGLSTVVLNASATFSAVEA
jgi:hypothetical protein